MSLIAIIIVLCVLGLLAWAAWAYLPIPQPIKGIICFLIILLAVVIVLNGVGVFSLGSVNLHR